MEITLREKLAKEISAWPLSLQFLRTWKRALWLCRRSAHTRVQGMLCTLTGSRSCRCTVQDLFFFFFFFPALPLETILPGSLYDDDITIHFLFGRAFFQMTFFSLQSPAEQVLGAQKWPQAHQMRCFPSPLTGKQEQN